MCYKPEGTCPICGYPISPGRCAECGTIVSAHELVAWNGHVCSGWFALLRFCGFGLIVFCASIAATYVAHIGSFMPGPPRAAVVAVWIADVLDFPRTAVIFALGNVRWADSALIVLNCAFYACALELGWRLVRWIIGSPDTRRAPERKRE